MHLRAETEQASSSSRYFTMYRPLAISMFRHSISSTRLTVASGTALGRADPARKIKSDTASGGELGSGWSVLLDASLCHGAD